MTKYKQIIIWALVILLIVVLGIFVFIFFKKIIKKPSDILPQESITEKKKEENKISLSLEEEVGIDTDYIAKYLLEDKLKKNVGEENYDNDYEIMQKAVFEKNESYCSELKEYPKDNCIYDIAVINKTSVLCEKISDQILKEDCLELIIKKESLAQENKLGQPHYTPDYKIMKKAILEKNSAYCIYLSEYSKDDCYHDIAIVNDVNDLCEKIDDLDVKKCCLERFLEREAIDEKDIDKCLTITEEELKKQCLFEIFQKMDEASECSNFDKDIKDDCEDVVYKNIAFNKDDKKICENIKNKTLKVECLVITKNKLKDSDGDGLFDPDERAYGTDPFKADTDGDGFDDGTEIAGGYNPLGQ